MGGKVLKNRILFLLLIFIVIVGACSNNNNNEAGENNTDQTNQSDVNQNEVEEEENDLNENIEEENEDVAEENEDAIEEVLEPLYEIDGIWRVVPIDDSANEKVVLLTIDDAPDNYAVEMAKTLHELDAPAIFFVNGHFIEREEDKAKLKEIYDLGFAIGNHTYSHPNLATIEEADQREEIVRVNDMVEEIIGERPVFFRPPFGTYTDYVMQVMEDENMVFMNWSYGYDWEADYRTKEALADIMINTELLGPGSNLLMHDREWTAAALRDIVIGLREKGYEIVDPRLIKTD